MAENETTRCEGAGDVGNVEVNEDVLLRDLPGNGGKMLKLFASARVLLATTLLFLSGAAEKHSLAFFASPLEGRRFSFARRETRFHAGAENSRIPVTRFFFCSESMDRLRDCNSDEEE